MRHRLREYRNAAPKLRSLSWREWRDLWAAQFALVVAQWRVWTKAQGRLTTSAADPVPAFVPPEDSVTRSRALALAVRRAAFFGLFRPACLVRSVALCRLMERHGIRHAVVRVGVVVSRGRFQAHAWVDYGGVILGDDPEHVADYETLSGVSVLHAD